MTEQRLFDDEIVADPHPYFDELRREDPVYAVGDSNVYLVTRMDLLKRIIADPETFSNHYVGFLQRDEHGQPYLLPMQPEADNTLGLWVLATADPPDHSRHRRVLQPHLTPNAVEHLVPTMRDFADELLTNGLHDGRMEAMSSYAELLPMRVIARLLDLPETTIPRMLEFGYASGERIGGLATVERLDELRQLVYGESAMFVREAYERARGRKDSTSLVADVVTAVDRGEINEGEAFAMLAVVVIAGGESTTSLIGTATMLLARHPDVQRRLRDQPSLIPTFVEEALRFEPPFRNHPRLVTRDTELAGVQIPRGAHVALMWPAANRDPDAFAHPNNVDIDREKSRTHVGFGWGIHLCVGAPLARAEARVAIETLLERSSRIVLDPAAEPPAYLPSIMIRRLRALPLRIDAP